MKFLKTKAACPELLLKLCKIEKTANSRASKSATETAVQKYLLDADNKMYKPNQSDGNDNYFLR